MSCVCLLNTQCKASLATNLPLLEFWLRYTFLSVSFFFFLCTFPHCNVFIYFAELCGACHLSWCRFYKVQTNQYVPCHFDSLQFCPSVTPQFPICFYYFGISRRTCQLHLSLLKNSGFDWCKLDFKELLFASFSCALAIIHPELIALWFCSTDWLCSDKNYPH